MTFDPDEPLQEPEGLQRDGSKVRCGTPSGFRLHQEHDENPCDACKRAKRQYDARRLQADDQTLKNRQGARAQGRAQTEMKRRHLEEYRELYRQFLAEVREEDRRDREASLNRMEREA